MSFAERLKQSRAARNITQEEFAEKLTVSRQAVSKWESGTGYPETEKLLQIAEVLDVSLDYLLLDKQPSVSVPDTPQPRGVGGRIAIMDYSKTEVVNCLTVKSASIFAAELGMPRYLLNGVVGTTLFGERSTVLGWYDTVEDVQREITAINEAMSRGEASYALQYDRKAVSVNFFGTPKFADDGKRAGKKIALMRTALLLACGAFGCSVGGLLFENALSGAGFGLAAGSLLGILLGAIFDYKNRI